MGYGAEMTQRALAELSRRRNQAQLEQERRFAEIDEKIPQIAALRKELAKTGIRLARLFSVKLPDTQAQQLHEHAQQLHEHAQLDALREQNLDTQRRICALLDLHGYPLDYLEPHPVCAKCGDTGFVGSSRCDCLTQLLKRMAERTLCDTAPMAKCRFEDFDLSFYPDTQDERLGIVARDKMAEILHYCKGYARTFSLGSPSLFMYGKTGLGKTHLSLAIADAVVDKGFGVIYGSAQDLLRKVEREHFGRDREALETLDTLLSTDLLILDDLGSEFESPFYTSAVYNIINTRLNRALPTIVNSNLSAQELEKRYSDRVVSRLRSMFYNLRFMGNDIRQLKLMRKVRG